MKSSSRGRRIFMKTLEEIKSTHKDKRDVRRALNYRCFLVLCVKKKKRSQHQVCD